MLGFLVLNAALAGAPDVPSEVWVDRGSVPPLCVSTLPGEAKLRKKDRGPYLAARDALTRGEPLPDLPDHPASDVLRASAEVLAGGSGEALLALADRYPSDPCLGVAAAWVALFVRGDVELAERHAARAWIRRPDAEVGLLLGTVLARQGEVDRMKAVVDRALRADPEHAGLRRLRASDPADLKTRYEQGRMDEYLQLAADMGAPLGPIADLPRERIGFASLREALGLQDPDDRLVAVLHTSEGAIACELTVDATPVTVASFVGLATGSQSWIDPRTGAPGEGPLYRDVPFHRVIPGFMIQTGDPTGTGTGGPGYRFHDEIAPGERFDRPGRLAMANAGPGTNGSQFFVTEAATPHLDGRHTIFGQCDAPAVVSAIAGVERDATDRPRRPVLLERVEIEVR